MYRNNRNSKSVVGLTILEPAKIKSEPAQSKIPEFVFTTTKFSETELEVSESELAACNST